MRPSFREYAAHLDQLDQYSLGEYDVIRYSACKSGVALLMDTNQFIKLASDEGTLPPKLRKALARGDEDAKKRVIDKLFLRYFKPSRVKHQKTFGEVIADWLLDVTLVMQDDFRKAKTCGLQSKDDYLAFLKFFTVDIPFNPILLYGLCCLIDELDIKTDGSLGFSLSELYWDHNENFFQFWLHIVKDGPWQVLWAYTGTKPITDNQFIFEYTRRVKEMTEHHLLHEMEISEQQRDTLDQERTNFNSEILKLHTELGEFRKENECLRKELKSAYGRIAQLEDRHILSSMQVTVLGDPGHLNGYKEILQNFGIVDISFADPITEIEKSQRLARQADVVFVITSYCSHATSYGLSKDKVHYVNRAGLEQFRREVEKWSANLVKGV